MQLQDHSLLTGWLAVFLDLRPWLLDLLFPMAAAEHSYVHLVVALQHDSHRPQAAMESCVAGSQHHQETSRNKCALRKGILPRLLRDGYVLSWSLHSSSGA
jgi:hypothetical protein